MSEIDKILDESILLINGFCAYIDSIDRGDNPSLYDFLYDCQKYISQLYAKISSLPDMGTKYLSRSKDVSEDIKSQRLQKFYNVSEKIKNLLGNNDLYWAVFDPYDLKEDDPSQSRLSNDIAEIYDDFGSILDKFKNIDFSTKEKLDILRISFKIHWYHHACRALTAISWLMYDKIDWDDYN